MAKPPSEQPGKDTVREAITPTPVTQRSKYPPTELVSGEIALVPTLGKNG